MSNIFTTKEFNFPYADYRFPGQANDEQILFVGRENSAILWWHRTLVIIVSLLLYGTIAWVSSFLKTEFNIKIPAIIPTFMFFAAIGVAVLGWWWASALWRKSIGIITTRRLTKFIFTTPFNRHNFSLPLDMVVDTGAYRKGFKQAIFGLETFTARSSASSSGRSTDDPSRVNKKYFYLENIKMAEDLQHYTNKLLYAFRHHQEHLPTFRPFISKNSGNREDLMTKYPDYWS
jgi:hypothetical protein